MKSIFNFIEENDFPDFLENGSDSEINLNSFHYAVWHGHEDFLEYFLGKKPELVDSQLKAYTALTRAICCNHYSIVKFLLENGANPNLKQIHQFSPLDICILRNKKDFARLLLENGAKPSPSSLSLAAMIDSLEMCELLIEFKASLKTTLFDNIIPFDFANDPDVLEILKI